MLVELTVKNLGIIEDVDWHLNEGLNIITGETGSGKSLIIDAVELLLSGSSASDSIRSGSDGALIEGVFQLKDDDRSASLKILLSEAGVPWEEGSLLINCELRNNRSSLTRVNGRAVTKTIFRQVGQPLIDIHGQSQHQSLLDKKNHLDLLDSFAHLKGKKKDYSRQFALLKEMERDIRTIGEKSEDIARQQELLKYQINEIISAKIVNGEDEALESERQIMAQSERLKEYCSQIYESIYEGESSRYSPSALHRLNEALKTLQKLADLDPSFKPQLEALEKSLYSLEDIARETRAYQEKLQQDPGRLEELEGRLELIAKLKRKYGKSLPDIEAFLIQSQKELAELEFSNETKAQLEIKHAALKRALGSLAGELSLGRSKAARQLESDVKRELQDLEMGHVQFVVSLIRQESQEGIDDGKGKSYAFGDDGLDEVEFMVSTNPGEPLKPLANIASTGEISRFTLALKGALSEADQIPVLIFDEIDIGVGGRSGEVLGKKLWNLSHSHQVVCVTHLPQIAAFADAHYCVRKIIDGQRTTSVLEDLSEKSHLQEMAQMLAGKDYSRAALESASELQKKAFSWKHLQQGPRAKGKMDRLIK